MKEVAVIICNYNKKNYVLKCIDSLLKSTYKDFDLYVIDNASNDESVEAIREQFKNSLNLIVNSENLGGSGGFNTGIKNVITRGYKYIYLLDNDIRLDENALKMLYEYMEENPQVGAVGSKIYSMDNPSSIQEFGSYIDFNIFNMKLMNSGNVDLNNNEEIIECDYVPACSALFRVEALQKSGNIDEQYFVYWDDIDLGHRIKLAGYKIAANSNSKVWHKGGGTVRTNTFGTYYFWRNRVHFFTKYCSEEEVEKFALKLFDEIFQSMYSCNYIGKYSSTKTILMAVNDALNGIRGKSTKNRIMELEETENKFGNIVKVKNNVLIIHNSEFKILRDIINKIKAVNKSVNITITGDSIDDLNHQFNDLTILRLNSFRSLSEYDLICKTCYHIFDVKDNIEDRIVYVDRFFNIIASRKDVEYVKNYDNTYNMLKNIWYPILLSKMMEYKQELKG